MKKYKFRCKGYASIAQLESMQSGDYGLLKIGDPIEAVRYASYYFGLGYLTNMTRTGDMEIKKP